MGQLNVAVIGCGVWGGNHARVYNTLPGVKLAAISDKDTRRAQCISEIYRTSGFTDTLKVLRDQNIDAVSICTPTCTHEYIASKALDEDKHVLVEKPMTDTVAEIVNLNKLASDQGLNLMVGSLKGSTQLSERQNDWVSDGRLVM